MRAERIKSTGGATAGVIGRGGGTLLKEGIREHPPSEISWRWWGQPGMLYYYFPSKAELFRAAMKDYVEHYVADVTAILEDRVLAPERRLQAALGLVARMLARFNIATDRGRWWRVPAFSPLTAYIF